MKKSEQARLVKRVREMEARFDKLTGILGALEEAISEFKASKDDLDALRNYMDSGQWLKDFEADEAGMIPAGLKRGVLSEDSLYDLLQEADGVIVSEE
jgi:hypothetical protein